MTPNEIAPHIETLRSRFAELESRLSDPSIFSRQKEFRDISREHQKLSTLVRRFDAWKSALAELDSNRKLFAEEQEDSEMRAMAAVEIERLEKETPIAEKEIRIALLPPDPNDGRDVIVEMRPAAGGEEAALFTGELSRAYTKYAESRGWRQEVLDLTGSSLGGIKEMIFSLSGADAYARMRYESGVHRVQRVPETEGSGRIHTSTITVSVMPEAEEVDIEIRTEDLRFDYFRSSGPGGQSVNRTDSAVRVTYLPTGLSVASQQEKSQHSNKATALRILRTRLLDEKRQTEAAKQAASKREQVGTGDRSERIRTYNFPQNRVTDHRYGVSVFDLPSLLEGELDRLLDEIIAIDAATRLGMIIK